MVYLEVFKAENYVRFVPLAKLEYPDGSLVWDGVFWAAKWELRVDRHCGKVKPPRSTDQGIQKETAVQLVSFWLCGRTMEQMHEGSSVARTYLNSKRRSHLTQ